ncbi:MAG: prepilin-type N-terminal cleavage/methylation domain-containing protein [Alphaproteobacteria bacterium]|nr:prepilin-type N-terminal cleavage/methylation domain-containing protein [Alphaproteobacteria bacterium]MBV9693544.1 prepilin-type N-terminal cleavage/methylation domain-containing protein [Alphaproteobacteria bacterium]
MKRSDGGFTLLELLVALTLLAFLSVALVAALRFGTASWRKSQDTNLQLHDIREAASAIEHTLARIYPKFIDRPPATPFVDFDGGQTRMQFFVADPRSGFLMRTVLSAERSGPLLSLRFKDEPDIVAWDAAPGRQLLGGLSGLAFAYFGQADGERGAAWHSSWHRQSALPTLIRVRIASGDRRGPVPEVLIAPRIAADVGCEFDAAIKFCRGRK